MEKFFTRMGDNSGIYMTADEIRYDLEEGTRDASGRGKFLNLPKKN